MQTGRHAIQLNLFHAFVTAPRGTRTRGLHTELPASPTLPNHRALAFALAVRNLRSVNGPDAPNMVVSSRFARQTAELVYAVSACYGLVPGVHFRNARVISEDGITAVHDLQGPVGALICCEI
jgi:hypothetical protein